MLNATLCCCLALLLLVQHTRSQRHCGQFENWTSPSRAYNKTLSVLFVDIYIIWMDRQTNWFEIKSSCCSLLLIETPEKHMWMPFGLGIIIIVDDQDEERDARTINERLRGTGRARVLTQLDKRGSKKVGPRFILLLLLLPRSLLHSHNSIEPWKYLNDGLRIRNESTKTGGSSGRWKCGEPLMMIGEFWWVLSCSTKGHRLPYSFAFYRYSRSLSIAFIKEIIVAEFS